MAKKESLREYQDGILEKMAAARMSDAEQLQLSFGFRAAGKNFLVSGKDIIEMAAPSKLEPIPISKLWAVGAANIKGSVYSVTDFSILMGGEPIKGGKFVMLSQEIMVGAAIMIESLTGLHELKNNATIVEDAGMKNMPGWITSCYEIAGERHYLVDAAMLAADTRFSKLQSGENQ